MDYLCPQFFMKESKQIFPEYIWMFFVGLLLAIIVCMQLLPGHAAESNYNYDQYVFFLKVSGWTVDLCTYNGAISYASFNSDGVQWTDNFEQDILDTISMLSISFGSDYISVYLINDNAVFYPMNFLKSALDDYGIHYVVGLNSIYTETEWMGLYDVRFLNYQGYQFVYYDKRSDIITPSPTPSPSPAYSFIVKRSPYSTHSYEYYLVDVFCEVSDNVSFLASTYVNQSVSDSGVSDLSIVNYPFFLQNKGYYSGSWLSSWLGPYTYFYVPVSSNNAFAVYYNMGSVLVEDPDYIRSTYSSVFFDNTENDSFFYSFLSCDNGYLLGVAIRGGQYSSVFFYPAFSDYVSYSFTESSGSVPRELFGGSSSSSYYMYGSIYNCAQYMRNTNFYVPTSTPSPTPTPDGWVASPTPEPSATPATVLMVTPVVTPVITFSASDLPGGASGVGGSISSQGGMSASEADSLYEYWISKLTNNQALAFFVSIFGFLPYELVFSLGTLIFILILIAMVRLFIHFIS